MFRFGITIMFGSLLNSIEVEAMMQQKPLVFACHYSNRHMARNVFYANPMVVAPYLLSGRDLLGHAYQHKWRNVYRYKLVCQHREYCGGKEESYSPPYDFIQQTEGQYIEDIHASV